jgi:hypothetical protein
MRKRGIEISSLSNDLLIHVMKGWSSKETSGGRNQSWLSRHGPHTNIFRQASKMPKKLGI